MTTLNVFLHDDLVGQVTDHGDGLVDFTYDPEWQTTPEARPLSLSLPLRVQPYRGAVVERFFENLLPESDATLQGIASRFQLKGRGTLDYLSPIGGDAIGAVRVLPVGVDVPVNAISGRALEGSDLARLLKATQGEAPLGMLPEYPHFRLTLSGAQLKTALLKHEGVWWVPNQGTPTTHILKLPIGKIQGAFHSLDLTESVDNEYLSMLIAREYGLPVANCERVSVNGEKALAVERFDRQVSSDGCSIIRRPQEDFCQLTSTSSAGKYESDGGPGIEAIMEVLKGSVCAHEDRRTFMAAQVLFWLLGATDGHAKNFSVFILPKGRFQLTPLYDIMSAYPVLGGQGLNIRKLKLAMGLKASKGKKYAIDQIFPRHFIATARAVGFDEGAMVGILRDFYEKTPGVIARVKAQLPADFSPKVRDSILAGLEAMAERLKGI